VSPLPPGHVQTWPEEELTCVVIKIFTVAFVVGGDEGEFHPPALFQGTEAIEIDSLTGGLGLGLQLLEDGEEVAPPLRDLATEAADGEDICRSIVRVGPEAGCDGGEEIFICEELGLLGEGPDGLGSLVGATLVVAPLGLGDDVSSDHEDFPTEQEHRVDLRLRRRRLDRELLLAAGQPGVDEVLNLDEESVAWREGN